MKKIYQIFILCFFIQFSNHLNGQDNNIKHVTSKALKEQVYIHYNSNLLFVGEYIHYTMYCTYLKNQEPSSISKIGYVALVGKGNKVIVRQKVRLVDGLGRGDFFIPVSVPTGNYKIIGYTNWMKNNKSTSFFEGDIALINPYQNKQNIDFVAEENLVSNNPGVVNNISSNNSIDVKLSKKVYKQRSKVNVSLFPTQIHTNGNYSVSVYKKNSIILNKSDFLNNYKDFKTEEANYIDLVKENNISLPELRGELIKGAIKTTDTSLPIQNISVSISIPSSNGYFLKFSKTNNKGEFEFILDKEYDAANAIIQVISKNAEDYKLTMLPHAGVDLSNLIYKKPRIPYSANQLILNRSIHNQIENAYFELKPDSILIHKNSEPFTMDNKIVYRLDDYTRFKTVKETLIEVIDNVWSKKINNDKYVFQVRMENKAYDYFELPEIKALVLVDGVVIQDHTIMMDYDARKIESISLLKRKYVYGEEVYQGIIEIFTKKRDFKLSNPNSGILNHNLFKPTQEIIYYKPKYEKNDINKHIPDFRYQLLWDPNITFKDLKAKEIEFYTSDVKGSFTLTLKGFTDNGKEVSVEKDFIVE
ncbi:MULTISPECIES: hypothetical protein [unclassified Cellulophaga]|uniref:hypothetical protein n=1 Tax=unclassified Cellulophaga TaxID=2634405 RepID=UPI0026E2361B|nr:MULTISPECIES: hypothetical protein [unclassified Cellulophaga]MDO6491594.1 hypothetical protein [Cellulophaga sp. 2_MG-2023]MDO6493471.1 hypothetical protein [Cellulophaga sp. 3_MG-2023]